MNMCTPGRSLLPRPLFALIAALAILAGAREAAAQTEFIPYFGKNQIRYDNFKWEIYTTDHFEIYYYPEIEPHLEKIASYAESAYQHVSSELKHDLAFKVPLILFSTSSEFWQQNVVPGAAQEGVGAFAEPSRYRIVMPMDEPSDLLYRLVVHELTHQFQYDIIPTSLIRNNMPLWVFEGMSDYMTGIWRSIDLMTVRDAAVADIVPKMSDLQGYGGSSNPRLIYNLGHAAFEFIEARWGKEGVRQFVFSLRKRVIGGGDNAFKEAFNIEADEWDQQFDRYLKERFKPFRDKERPADYGRDLAPSPQKSRYSSILSAEPSPSGDLIAAMSGNQRDRELDILLISAKDGSIVRNLTKGFDQDLGFENIPFPGMRFNTVPLMSWSPQGDRIAYFVRTEKDRSLLLQNVISRKIEMHIPMTTVDSPESPDISPDGKLVAFAAARGIINDIYTINLETKEIVNLTKDEFADYSPTWAPDGKSIVYLKRVSGNEKLFQLDLATGKSTQLTFGTHDEGGAQFVDANTLVFTSTATDPAKALDPDVAKNGAIHNVWTLNLKTGDLQQYTDALAGNFSPVVLHEGAGPPADSLRHLLQRRVRAAHARAQGSARQSEHLGLRRAWSGDRLPGADHSHARRREQEEEGEVRKDVPRRAPAGRPRRDERRRLLRRHADLVQRRARRSAVQPVRLLRLAVPHDVAHVSESRAADAVRVAGLLADRVLLRPARRPLLRPGVQRSHRPRPGGRHAHGARRVGVRDLPVQQISPRRDVRQPGELQRRVRRSGPRGLLAAVSAAAVRPDALQQRDDGPARRHVHPGDHGLPRIRSARRQHGPL